MSSKPYDIVILPEADLAAKAVRTSEELAPLGTEYILDSKNCAPHVSLYMAQLKAADLPKLQRLLEAIAARTSSLQLEATDYVQNWGYIDVGYEKIEAIANLQIQIVEAINPIRDGLRAEAQKHLELFEGLARQNIELYGEHRIGELFRPHLTFARFTSRHAIPLEDMGAPSAFSGNYAKLALFELGEHGTCARKVVEFDLQ